MSQRNRPRRKARHIWEERAAYEAQTLLELVGLVLACGGIIFVIGVIGDWLGY